MLIFIDVERTGFENDDKICSIAIIMEDEKKSISFYYELINPHKKISSKASSINHITKDMLKDAPDFLDSTCYKILKEHNNIENRIIAHDINRTLELLTNEGLSFKGGVIDTMRVTKHLVQDLENYELQFLRYELKLYKQESKLALHVGIKEPLIAHNALSDTLHVKMLYEFHLQDISEEKMSNLTFEPVLMQRLPFGKFEGRYIEEIAQYERAYLEWMLKIEDLNEDLRYSIEMSL